MATRVDVRVVGAVVGDITREPGARTKYGTLFQAVARRFEVVDVYDASLKGGARARRLLMTAHPDRGQWQQRYHMSLGGFRERSSNAACYLAGLAGRMDVALQVGVMFDARWGDPAFPSVIYTDYTARLSAQRPEAGRSHRSARERAEWVALERQAFGRASHICARSRFVRDSIVEDYAIPPERVTVIGGGVNLPRLPESVERPADRPPTVLFIGKEFHRKGGDLLLRAFALARDAVPDARLLLLTGDPIPAGLPLDGVETVAPTWDRERIAQLYRQADLFALPSRLETWGDVLLEAMAFGLPCVGVATDAMDEIIADEQTGVIVPPEDVDALAGALIRLLRDPRLRLEWGAAARDRVRRDFTWDCVADRLAPALTAAADAGTGVESGRRARLHA